MIRCCAGCGYGTGGRDPVREVVYGADGPHAVIATTLFQMLPKERRKVLAFADGRQEAAYFAWYLDDSYRDVLNRNLLLRAIIRASAHTREGLSLADVANELRALYRQEKIQPASQSDLETRRAAWKTVHGEFLTDETRISLEGVGAIRWTLQLPAWIEIPRVLVQPPWSLSEPDAKALLLLLLETLRADRAVDLRTDASVTLAWSDLGAQMSPRQFVIGPPGKRYAVSSWDGANTRRVHLLVKLLKQKGISHDTAKQTARETLRANWASLTENDRDAPRDREQLLVQADVGRWLNPDWYRVFPTTDSILYRCTTCTRLASVSVAQVCPRKNCSGTLEPVSARDLELNHYRLLYADTFPGVLRVEEHTAQLAHDQARTFQREFREGKIHVLSCSTTFELGVDLGTLDTIFLRNVPPESFNYVQRVGRAGRRREFPGLALTYCRRAPHDLYHFANPQRMMRGKVRPPVLAIQNEKIITRHITAVALSSFFRAHPERFANVTAFVGDWQTPRAVADVQQHLRTQRAALENSLRAIVPASMFERVGLHDGSWMERVAGRYPGLSEMAESRVVMAEAEVVSDYQNVLRVMEDAKQKNEFKLADWARLRANTIADENLLNFLSRKVVIPKYGFPVDVVELDTQPTQRSDAATVSLQRDLAIAIAEFAPTCEVVANKKIWKSYALKRVAEKEWERWCYRRCAKHNVYVEWKESEAERPLDCGDAAPKREYIIPKFGFITNREPPKPPSRRPARVFTTRPYFARAVGQTVEPLAFPPPRAHPFAVQSISRRHDGFV